MVTLGGMVLKVSDAGRAARFWSEALGYLPDRDRPWVLRPPGDGPVLFLDEDDRSHLDLWADPGEQDAEIDRLVALGATRPPWGYAPDADHVVLADPDGNLFCVVDAKSGRRGWGPRVNAMTAAPREWGLPSAPC